MGGDLTSIVAIVTLFGGGTGFVGWWVAMRKNNGDYQQNQVKLILETLQKDNEFLRKEIERINTELQSARELTRTLSRDIDYLRLQLQGATITSKRFDYPIPTLLKAVNGDILFANDAYDHLFVTRMGGQLKTWLGTKESDHWNSSFIAEHDSLVLDKEDLWDGEETFHFGNEVETFRVIRFPRYENDTVITGIVSMYIPLRSLSN